MKFTVCTFIHSLHTSRKQLSDSFLKIQDVHGSIVYNGKKWEKSTYMSNEERLVSHTSTVKNKLVNKCKGVDILLHQGMHRIAWTTCKLLSSENRMQATEPHIGRLWVEGSINPPKHLFLTLLWASKVPGRIAPNGSWLTNSL